jgi:hypothetical protein
MAACSLGAMNLLAEYLTARDGFSLRGNVQRAGLELARIAKAADVNFMHLYQVALGTRRPSWKLAQVIERETGGKVTAAGMLAGHRSAAQRRRESMK